MLLLAVRQNRKNNNNKWQRSKENPFTWKITMEIINDNNNHNDFVDETKWSYKISPVWEIHRVVFGTWIVIADGRVATTFRRDFRCMTLMNSTIIFYSNVSLHNSKSLIWFRPECKQWQSCFSFFERLWIDFGVSAILVCIELNLLYLFNFLTSRLLCSTATFWRFFCDRVSSSWNDSQHCHRCGARRSIDNITISSMRTHLHPNSLTSKTIVMRSYYRTMEHQKHARRQPRKHRSNDGDGMHDIATRKRGYQIANFLASLLAWFFVWMAIAKPDFPRLRTNCIRSRAFTFSHFT